MNKTNKWETDSSSINKNDIEKLLYTNKIIDNFLLNENVNFIVAAKGLGKTLILQQKRLLLEKEYGNSAIFIPNNTPFLDNTDNFGTLSKNVIQFLSNIQECKKLWLLALKLSAISFHNYDKKNITEISSFFNFELSQILPTNMMTNLLSLNISDLKKFIKNNTSKIDDIFRNVVHSRTLIFIDRVDQALYDYINDYEKEISRMLWINIQAGLMFAAWEFMQNDHVKIYTSLRQEAFAGIDGYKQDLNAMNSKISHIKYTKEELKKIINKLAKIYENKEDYYHFLGFEKIENTFYNYEEDAFTYIKRHSLNRPRDLVAICHDISLLENIEKDFKITVNNKSSEITVNYFDAQKPFLNLLDNKDTRNNFFKLIDFNILTEYDLANICEKFNQVPCDKNCSSCELSHPFCELYNIGLLGILQIDNVNNRHKQKFLNPSEINTNSNRSLPKSLFYLLHPSLENIIRKSKISSQVADNYKVLKPLVIGDNLSWEEKDINKILLYKKLLTKNKKMLNNKEFNEFLEKEILKKNKIENKESFILKFSNKLQDKFATVLAKEGVEEIVDVIKDIDITKLWSQ